MRHMHAPPSDCVYVCVPGPKVGSKVGFPTLFPLLIFWGIGAYICGDVFPGNGEHCLTVDDLSARLLSTRTGCSDWVPMVLPYM